MCLCVEDALNTISLRWEKMAKSAIKPFGKLWTNLTNKGNLENPEIMLQDKGNIVSDESVLVKTFTEHYINIVEKLCGKNLKYFIRIWRYE